MGELWLYCAWLAEHLALSVADIDRAIMRGFGWEMGPFAMWQAANQADITACMQKSIQAGDFHTTTPLPEWVTDTPAFYLDGSSFHPERRAYVEAAYCQAAKKHYRCQPQYTEINQNVHTHYTSKATCIWSPKRSCDSDHTNTPMGTIGQQVIDDLQRRSISQSHVSNHSLFGRGHTNTLALALI